MPSSEPSLPYSDGTLVGEIEGTAVRIGVGAVEGAAVGLGDGAAVGEGVGTGMGANVGAAVTAVHACGELELSQYPDAQPHVKLAPST